MTGVQTCALPIYKIRGTRGDKGVTELVGELEVDGREFRVNEGRSGKSDGEKRGEDNSGKLICCCLSGGNSVNNSSSRLAL